jgi:hypothetical protein
LDRGLDIRRGQYRLRGQCGWHWCLCCDACLLFSILTFRENQLFRHTRHHSVMVLYKSVVGRREIHHFWGVAKDGTGGSRSLFSTISRRATGRALEVIQINSWRMNGIRTQAGFVSYPFRRVVSCLFSDFQFARILCISFGHTYDTCIMR